ncbi:hypothetical protein [Nitrospira sp. Nam80]
MEPLAVLGVLALLSGIIGIVVPLEGEGRRQAAREKQYGQYG